MSKKKKKKKRATGGAAGFACPGCGDTRELFWHGRRFLCEPCLDRTAHPVERTPVGAVTLLQGGFSIFREVAAPAILVTVLCSLPLATVSYLDVNNLALAFGLDSLSLLGVASCMELGLAVLDGEKPRLGAALGVGVKKFLPLFLGVQIVGLIVMVLALFAIVPGVLKALSYAVLVPLVVSGEAGPIGALEESRRRMQGHRRAAFPALMLVWLPGLVAAIQGSAQLLDMSAPGARAPWANELATVTAIGFPLLNLGWVFVALALHAKLRGDHRVPYRPEHAS